MPVLLFDCDAIIVVFVLFEWVCPSTYTVPEWTLIQIPRKVLVDLDSRTVAMEVGIC